MSKINTAQDAINRTKTPPESSNTATFTYSNGFYPFDTAISLVWYFTKQSNIIILIIILIYPWKRFFKNNKYDWYSYLIFIGLIDIFITSVVFHVIINKTKIFYKPTNCKNIISHFEHTIIPILFLLFYFIFTDKTIPYKHIWVTWIHPSIYFIFFCFYGYFNLDKQLSNDSENKIISDPTSYYPYPFLSPFVGQEQQNENQKKITFHYGGYHKIFKCFMSLFGLFTFSTYILLFLKKHNLNEYD